MCPAECAVALPILCGDDAAGSVDDARSIGGNRRGSICRGERFVAASAGEPADAVRAPFLELKLRNDSARRGDGDNATAAGVGGVKAS